MLKRIKPTLLVTLVTAAAACAHAAETHPRARLLHAPPHARAVAAAANDREQDGLAGPVRRVKTETAKITAKNAKPVEGPRVVLETATYDIKGNKIDNAYFLAASGGTLTGKEVYKYDDKGNIVEMTLHNEDGSLLSKETYSYEFDAFGNWTKMITSVAVVEGGKMSFEPTEVTYRTISYFLDEATLAKMSQPAAAQPPAAQPAANTSAAPAQPTSAQPTSAQPAASNTAAAAVRQPAANAANTSAASAPATTPAGAQPKTPAGGPASPSNSSTAAAKSDVKASAPPAANASDRPSVASAPQVAPLRVSEPGAASVVDSEAEAPSKPIARGPVKAVSGGILNGKAVSLPAPLYPEMAKRARTGGVVTVDVVIDLTGRVISAKASAGPEMLRGAAENAAKQARFSPTLLSGQPVRVSGQINYNFTLK